MSLFSLHSLVAVYCLSVNEGKINPAVKFEPEVVTLLC